MQMQPFRTFLAKIAALISVSVATFVLTCIVLFFVIGLLVSFLTSLAEGDFSSSNYKVVFGEEGSGNTFLSIPVTGIILGSTDDLPDPFAFISSGITYGYEVKEEFYKASENSDIKGVILEVNSPGGTIYGSKAIADGIEYYKRTTNNPVITHISGIGASGSYLAGIASDYVTADYGSTIGSIGVLFGPFKFYDTVTSESGGAFVGGVVTQNGIETTYITAGRSKDLGNPYRQLTPEEIRVLQSNVNNEYDAFVAYVSERRSLPGEQIRSDIGALIYDTENARELGLIDATINKQDAYRELAKRGEIQDDFHIIQRIHEQDLFTSFLETTGKTSQPVVSTCFLSSMFLAYYGDITALCK